MTHARSGAWNYYDSQSNAIGGGTYVVAPDSNSPPSLELNANGGLTPHKYVFGLQTAQGETKYRLDANDVCKVDLDITTVTAASIAYIL